MNEEKKTVEEEKGGKVYQCTDNGEKVEQSALCKAEEGSCTIKEACEMLGKSRPTIYRLIRKGVIRSRKVGGSVYLSRGDVCNVCKF